MTEEVKEIAKELEDIGLSEKEAKVYLALLEVGQETVQNISKKANVNRATTYVILESLQKKGIVTTFEQAKKTFFIAEGPSALYNIIREQQEELEKKDGELDEMMNQLMTVYNLHPDKPKISFYEGKEGLKEMIRLRQNDNPSEARIFLPHNKLSNLFNEEEREEMSNKRLQKNILNIVIRSGVSRLEVTEKQSAEQRVAPEEIDFSSDIEVWGEKVLIASLEGDISGIIIESKVVAETLKNIFDLSFRSCK